MSPVLTPRQIFHAFDRGEITRQQFRDALRPHALGLIEEMVEVHENPLVAWLEVWRNRGAAARLVKAHGEGTVRELLVALADVPEFPLANWLWNADQRSVPLYCFLRTRREPVFRVLKIVTASFVSSITVEHGSAQSEDVTRERFHFHRGRFGELRLGGRNVL